jgi:hypothetical protein
MEKSLVNILARVNSVAIFAGCRLPTKLCAPVIGVSLFQFGDHAIDPDFFPRNAYSESRAREGLTLIAKAFATRFRSSFSVT